MDMSSYMKMVYDKAHAASVFVSLYHGDKVPCGGLQVNGYFDCETRILAVAMNKPIELWLPIMVHEVNHMQQWIDFNNGNFPLWGECHREIDKIDLWLDGEDFLDEDLDALFLKAKRIEADCEKRSLEIIRKYQLPIDDERYARAANAYIHFYDVCRAKRKWYTTAPYEIDEIIELMSTEICDATEPTPIAIIDRMSKLCMSNQRSKKQK